MNKWVRHRFYTRSVDDPRPLVFNPRYPWWESGYGQDFAVIVAYLPEDENLYKYWDDAFNIESTEQQQIVFTNRFPRPDYFLELN